MGASARSFAVLLGALIAAPASAGSVTLKTADGRTILAESSGQGPHGVVLVHDAGRSRDDWSSFGQRLADNGFAVLALDLRGHGASSAAEPTLSDASWPAMKADVIAGVDWLEGRTERVTVVGASFGAGLALSVAAERDAVDAVVLLSPSVSSRGVSLVAPVASFEGPLLLVGDSRDPAAAKTATLLGGKAGGNATVELVAAGAAGHRMLNTVPELEALVVGWIHGARGEGPALASPDRTLEAGTIDAIETTGDAYGTKR